MDCGYQNESVPTGAGPSTPRCFFQVVEEIVIDCGFNHIYSHIHPPFLTFIHCFDDIGSLFPYYKV